jgi:hypothetical protein
MSLADDKRGVFTTIGAYTSLNKQPKPPTTTDSISSVNNSNETIPYLLDVLKVIAGSSALKEVIGGLFTKIVDTAEPQLKTALKNQFTHSNSGDAPPASFNSNGINVPVKNVDTKGKLKVDSNSESGNLLYNNNTPNFDSTARNAIVNAGSTQQYNGLSITYNSTTDNFNIKPTSQVTNIGNFFSNYINNTQILNKKEIVSNVMDNIYGTLANKSQKSIQEIQDELQVNKMLEQAINNADNPFVISPQDLRNLLQNGRDMAAGVVNYDMGCGVMPATLNFNDLSNLVKNISGSTDPFGVGNAIEATINQSTSGSTSTSATSTANQQTIKDGFFQKIITIFTVIMLAAVTIAPQIRVLIAIMTALENSNGQPSTTQPKNDLQKFSGLINCMAKQIIILIGEFIFTLAIGYLVKLLTPIIKQILKEKINQFVGIIKSLTGTSISSP